MFTAPPLALAIAVRLGWRKAGFWASVLALGWFSHGVMSAWSHPETRWLALIEIALALLVIFSASLPACAPASASGADAARPGPYHLPSWPRAAVPVLVSRMHMMEELLVVTTGGTIDKIYFDDKSNTRSAIRRSA